MADELNRWLRAVRPSTSADEGWAASTDGEAALAEIHHRTRRRGVRSISVPRRRFVWVPASAIAAAAVVLLAVMLASPTRPDRSTASGPQPGPVLRPVAQLLHPFASCPSLLAGLREHAAAHIAAGSWQSGGVYSSGGGYAVPGAVSAGAPEAQASAGTANGASGGTSTTNVQEIGVDEPDIVKTDGGRVITATDGVLRVIDASRRGVTATLNFRMYAGWETARLLASGDAAVLLLDDNTMTGGPISMPARGGVDYPAPMPPIPVRASGSTVLFVSLSGTPTVAGTMHVDGRFIDARMVGSTVRLVASSQPAIAVPTTPNGTGTSTARAAVEQAPLSAWLPTYAIGNTQKAVPCTSVSAPDDYTGASMLTVYTLRPDAPNADPKPISVAADGDTVYATGTSLYVASNPNWCCTSTTTTDTQIHRFDITGTGAPSYVGSGTVPGRLLNQYSMSDYEGHLRVATTLGRPGTQTQNDVTVLDAGSLKVTGQVTGIAPGESIFAVRFLGGLGYVVTFQQAMGDPLFVIDLHDPAHPRVAGELKVPGYSTYLHDVGGGKLLAIGQDNGFQVALYDVHDPSHPTRTAQLHENGWGGGSFDPHAFLYWPATRLASVPVYADGSPEALVVRVAGGDLQRVGTVTNQVGTIQRSLIVDGNLWTLSNGGIRVSDRAHLAQRAWIGF